MATKKENETLVLINERTRVMAQDIVDIKCKSDVMSDIVKEHTILLKGTEGQEGLVSMVNRHDRYLWKFCGGISVLLFLFEIWRGLK